MWSFFILFTWCSLFFILFATFGNWLALRNTRRRETIRETVVVKEVLVPAEAPAIQPFALNTFHQRTAGITARELEILTLPFVISTGGIMGLGPT